MPAEKTVTVSSGASLDVDGIVYMAGTVSVASGGILKGPVLGEYGASSESNTISYTGSGKVELAQGAEGWYGNTLFISAGDTGLYKWDSSGSGGKITLSGSNST